MKAQQTAEYVGRSLDKGQIARLTRYHDWLANEAVRAGGVGPHEVDRIWDRHIADSLAFALGVQNDGECLDIGTGVGLPGVPLAVMLPEVEFTLVDRSGRRCDLVARAVRILGLTNCVVAQQDIRDVDDRFETIVSRAAIPMSGLLIHVKRLLKPGGTAMIGLSRTTQDHEIPSDIPEGLAVSVATVPAKILDSGASLLRIESS